MQMQHALMICGCVRQATAHRPQFPADSEMRPTARRLTAARFRFQKTLRRSPPAIMQHIPTTSVCRCGDPLTRRVPELSLTLQSQQWLPFPGDGLVSLMLRTARTAAIFCLTGTELHGRTSGNISFSHSPAAPRGGAGRFAGTAGPDDAAPVKGSGRRRDTSTAAGEGLYPAVHVGRAGADGHMGHET